MGQGLTNESWRGALFAVLFLVAYGCSEEGDQRYSTPAATFSTYQEALRLRDMDALWACYSSGYRDHLSGGRAAWEQGWRTKPEEAWRAELGREIAEERVIDAKIAYLLFHPSTVMEAGTPQFFYLVRENEGWHLTSHLDGVFHQRLERALQNGTLKLPPP